MSTYSKIYEYLESTPNERAHILPTTDRGGWYLGGQNSLLSGISGPLKTLIREQVPDGTQVDTMWLWLRAGKMRFSYRTVSGDLRTLLLIPSHFEDFS